VTREIDDVQEIISRRVPRDAPGRSDEDPRAGFEVPAHCHPYEQTGYLVSGRLRFTVAGERFDAVPGSSWSIAADVEHAAEVLEDAVVIEVFSPVREDYLRFS
jgi:quercetin dioxygenase-like cupin family protein